MKVAKQNAIDWPEKRHRPVEGAVIGYIVDIRSDGVALVDFTGSPNGPCPARSAIAAPPDGEVTSYLGRKVALIFENGDPSLPVVIGWVHDTLFPADASMPAPETDGPKEVVVDGDILRLDAKEAITLCCGESAVVLKKNGQVVVRGVEITNRATRTNKIKGGSVRIN